MHSPKLSSSCVLVHGINAAHFNEAPQTPLGALSVVICAILSSIFLNETLTFFGWLGCGLCIVRYLLPAHPTMLILSQIGSVIIALNGSTIISLDEQF